MNVRKTDGSFQEFDSEKIKHGICEAFASVGEACNNGLIEALIKNLFIYEKISSQEIRRQVEESLMSINKKVAKSYIKQNKEIYEKVEYYTKYKGELNVNICNRRFTFGFFCR